jgi:hypothetical protein
VSCPLCGRKTPTPAAFRQALDPLARWFREEFLPQLSQRTLLVVASRTPPPSDWSAEAGVTGGAAGEATTETRASVAFRAFNLKTERTRKLAGGRTSFTVLSDKALEAPSVIRKGPGTEARDCRLACTFARPTFDTYLQRNALTR